MKKWGTQALLPVASLWAALCFPLPSLAGEAVQRKGAATLEIRYEGDTRDLALSDIVTVTLKIEGSPSGKITAPLELSPAAKWLLDEPAQTVRETLGPGRMRWQRIYRFAPREPGQITFAFPDVQISDGEMDPQTVTWEPIDFIVTTKIAQLDRSALRDITGVEISPSSATPPEPSWHWWLLAVLLVLMVGTVVFVLRRLLRRKHGRAPLERALYEWQRLLAMKLPERGRSERFITLLTLLVRDYLEREFDLPARRRTTREFLHGMTLHAVLTEAEKLFLTRFLERSEAVKFAHVEMPPEECASWAEQVRLFLRERGNDPVKKPGQAYENLPVEKNGQSG
jgi:hypothetical protein